MLELNNEPLFFIIDYCDEVHFIFAGLKALNHSARRVGNHHYMVSGYLPAA